MRRMLRWSMAGLAVLLLAAGCVPKAGTVPIASSPAPAGCITDVGPSEKLVVEGCGGDISYNVSVPARCLQYACGLVVDVHGWTMSGDIQEAVTGIAALGRERGYIVVQPTAPGDIPSWNSSHYPLVAAFTELAIDVWRVDERRVHVTGFSQGGAMTFWMRCNRPDLFASVAPTAAAGSACSNGVNLPTLYVQGNNDIYVSAAAITATINSFVTTYGLDPGVLVGQGPLYRHTAYPNPTQGEAGLVTLIHDYSTEFINGHCVFGPPDPTSFYGCDQPAPFSHGSIIMDFFELNPRRT
jgi:poly(3-hydroxybutyrate) depolymerase